MKQPKYLSRITLVVYMAAIAVVLLDIFVWRP